MQVQKKDGRLEDFSREKLYNSFLAAGLSPVDAEEIAKQVQAWVEMSETAMTTAEIRKRAIGLMETKDVQASENYANYQKPTEEVA